MITFGEVAEACLAVTLAVQPDTRAKQQRMLKARILPFLGDREFSVITPEDILECIDPLLEAGLAPKTIKNYVDLASQVFRFGVRRGLRPDNPCLMLPIRGLRNRVPERKRVLLEPAEARLLVSAAEPEARLLLRTLLATGLRWGEATALQVRDTRLDATRPHLDVSKAWKRGRDGRPVLGPPKSRNAIRQSPVPPFLADELRAAIEGRDPSEFLFTDTSGRPWSHSYFYRLHWAPTLHRARAAGLGKQPRLHDLRHTFASWVMEESSIYAAFKLLGHATSQTTADLYGGLTGPVHDSVLRALEARVGEAVASGSAG